MRQGQWLLRSGFWVGYSSNPPRPHRSFKLLKACVAWRAPEGSALPSMALRPGQANKAHTMTEGQSVCCIQ
ncbi:hypothetical protein C8Q78DRAFT_1047496 [Trametes maxima]|nr:hypothetical protein C8Q78DRAFT_1047496 [Trametes maxima]